MSGKLRRLVLWFRNDLRIHDNMLLSLASELHRQTKCEVLCVYCFDPLQFSAPTRYGNSKSGYVRTKFLIESVQSLRSRLEQIGAGLLVSSFDSPSAILARACVSAGSSSSPSPIGPSVRSTGSSIERLCEAAGTVVLVHEEVAFEEMACERTVATSLSSCDGFLERLPSCLPLYHPLDVPFRVDFADMSNSFTAFKDTIERSGKPRAQIASVKCLPPPPLTSALGALMNERCNFSYLPTVEELLSISIPSSPPSDSSCAASSGSEPLGLESSSPPHSSPVLKFIGGELAGLQRCKNWIFDGDNLRSYFDIRNGMLGEAYSSKFSPWLALGCLSPRFIFEEVKRYEKERYANKSTYWLIFELLWRDFFHYFVRKHGSRIFFVGGVSNIKRKWVDDEERVKRWKSGTTGHPLVDANMRELLHTGWMSNRGRQNVASFLIFDYEIDWRIGADWFESRLIDHDVCSNYGNWNFAAGLTGGRINRFNISKQSRDYDPKGEYIRHWLPELRHMPVPHVFEPWRASLDVLERAGVKLDRDYPSPLAVSSRVYAFDSVNAPHIRPVALGSSASPLPRDWNVDRFYSEPVEVPPIGPESDQFPQLGAGVEQAEARAQARSIAPNIPSRSCRGRGRGRGRGVVVVSAVEAHSAGSTRNNPTSGNAPRMRVVASWNP